MPRAATSTGGGRDSDSEGDHERPFVEQQPPWLIAAKRVSWWGGESEPKNRESALGVRGRRRAPGVLADKRDGPGCDGGAVVVGAHARRRRRVRMRAPGRRGVVAPCLAQQAGVLPDCQRQYDRNKSGSEHVDARDLQWQERRQRDGTESLRVSADSPGRAGRRRGILAGGAENSALHACVEGPEGWAAGGWWSPSVPRRPPRWQSPCSLIR